MQMWQWLVVAASALTLIMMIVNTINVSTLQNEVSSLKNAGTSPPQDIESLLMRGQSGEKVPKKAYLLNIGLPEGDTSDSEDAEETVKIIVQATDDPTDAAAFFADLKIQRIKYVYRPDNNNVFEAMLPASATLGTSFEITLTPVSGQLGSKFAPLGLTATGKWTTVIGLPRQLVPTVAA